MSLITLKLIKSLFFFLSCWLETHSVVFSMSLQFWLSFAILFYGEESSTKKSAVTLIFEARINFFYTCGKQQLIEPGSA